MDLRLKEKRFLLDRNYSQGSDTHKFPRKAEANSKDIAGVL